MTFEIPEQNFERLAEKIAKLNRKAAKLACAPITFVKTGEKLYVGWYPQNKPDEMDWFPMGEIPSGYVQTGYIRKSFLVEVTGEAPKFNGWTFIATVQHTTEGNLLRKAPGTDDINLEAYRATPEKCDHCRINRYRIDTFVVRHDNGEMKQVGRSCLRDFLGHANPEALAKMAEIIFSLKELCQTESEWGYGSGEQYFSLSAYLAHVAYWVKLEGYVSRKEERESLIPKYSTASLAINSLFPPKETPVSKRIYPADDHKELVEKAVEFTLEKLENQAQKNDFEHNIYTVAKMEAIDCRMAGIAAYIIQYYLRAVEAQLKNGKSEFFGEVKKRYKAQSLTYTGSNSFESQYGICWIHKFIDTAGNQFVWKTSSPIQEAQGTSKVVDFTVKDHSEYKGTKQTNITRVSWA